MRTLGLVRLKLEVWTFVALVAGAAASYIGLWMYHNRFGHAEELGRSEWVQLLDGRSALVVPSRVTFPSPEMEAEAWRLSVYDLRQGELLGVRMTGSERHCLPASPDKLWCTESGGVALHSAPSLELLHDPRSLVATVPVLAAGLRPRGHFQVDLETGELLVPTADGLKYMLEPVHLSARPFDGVERPGTTLRAGLGFERAPDSVEMAGARYAFRPASGEQQHLVVDAPEGPRVVYEAPMLAPTFLPDGVGAALASEGRFFWTYDTSLDRRQARRVLVGWGPSVEPWRLEGPRAPIVGQRVDDGRLLVIWGGPRVELEAVEVTTGKRLWVRHL